MNLRGLDRGRPGHAQFKTIHPFVDSNRRTGRPLIHTILRRADALRNLLIPINTVVAGNTYAYTSGLTAGLARRVRSGEPSPGSQLHQRLLACAMQCGELAIDDDQLSG